MVGSCNLDHVIDAAAIPRPGETVHGSGVRLFNGGKGANQAVAAARDRAVVILVGAVGADEGGESTLRDLCAEGVDVGHLAVIEGMPTGSAHIVVDPSGENCIVVIPGANARVDAAFVTGGLATLDGPSGDVCLTGFELPADAVDAAADRARECGARLVVNPAPAAPLSAALLSAAPILTPNAGEATALTGDADASRAATKLSHATGTWVIVTMGGDGVLLAGGDAVEHIPAHPVAPVDTTGAGDAFAGVFAAALAAGLDVPTAARRANAAAALSVTAPGARSGMPRSDAIDALLSS